MARGTNSVIREAVGAGRWFSANPSALKKEVVGYVESANVQAVRGRIVAAIAPHAGYVYSGPVAGHTFRAIRDNRGDSGKGTTVVILGVSHRMPFSGLALMDGDAVRTPLGLANMDVQTAQAMAAASKRIFLTYAPHRGEHSAENQIPFLQVALPESSIVVGLFGEHAEKTVDDTVRALVDLSSKTNMLVLASSDMLHDPDYPLVTTTDRKTLEDVSRMDHGLLAREWRSEHQTFCGIGPVLTAMRFAEATGCHSGTVLRYRNSGDDFPESRGSWVVGYGSVVFAA